MPTRLKALARLTSRLPSSFTQRRSSPAVTVSQRQTTVSSGSAAAVRMRPRKSLREASAEAVHAFAACARSRAASACVRLCARRMPEVGQRSERCQAAGGFRPVGAENARAVAGEIDALGAAAAIGIDARQPLRGLPARSRTRSAPDRPAASRRRRCQPSATASHLEAPFAAARVAHAHRRHAARSSPSMAQRRARRCSTGDAGAAQCRASGRGRAAPAWARAQQRRTAPHRGSAARCRAPPRLARRPARIAWRPDKAAARCRGRPCACRSRRPAPSARSAPRPGCSSRRVASRAPASAGRSRRSRRSARRTAA